MNYTTVLRSFLLCLCVAQVPFLTACGNKGGNGAVIKEIDELAYRRESAKLHVCFMYAQELADQNPRENKSEYVPLAAHYFSERQALDAARHCEDVDVGLVNCRSSVSVMSATVPTHERSQWISDGMNRCDKRYSSDQAQFEETYSECFEGMREYRERFIEPIARENYMAWIKIPSLALAAADAQPSRGEALKNAIASMCVSTYSNYLGGGDV